MNYVYKMQSNGGYMCLSTSVTAANIFFPYGGNNPINVAATNRKAVNNGRVVTKMTKKRFWSN